MWLGNSIRSSFWLPMAWPKWRLEDEFSTQKLQKQKKHAMFRVQDATLQTHLDIFGLEILRNPLEILPQNGWTAARSPEVTTGAAGRRLLT